MTNTVEASTDEKIEEYNAMAHISIESGVKLFILQSSFSCTFCYPGTCQIVLRSINSKGLCEGKKKMHYDREVLYLQKVNVYMEDDLVPHIFVKNAEISDVMTEKDDTNNEEDNFMVNVTSSNYVLLTLFFLFSLCAFFEKRMNRNHVTKKHLRRNFYGIQNKKQVKISPFVYDEVPSLHKMKSPSILTSHKLIDISTNPATKMIKGNESPAIFWNVVSHRKRSSKFWYGPIKPGDFYSDS